MTENPLCLFSRRSHYSMVYPMMEFEMEAPELLKNPKFVALWVAIWAFMVLAVLNIITKINLFMQLTAE
jgi:hypothetical protein